MFEDLTDTDRENIRQYLAGIEALEAREPERLSAEVWDEVSPSLQRGEIPEKYRDRIGACPITEGQQTTAGYYDIVREAWNAECSALWDKYRDSISRVLISALKSAKDEEAKSVSIKVLDLLNDFVNFVEPPTIKVTAKRVDKLEYPVDKVNSVVWESEKYNVGQLIKIALERRGAGKQVNIFYSINFDAIEENENVTISKQLLPFDKRVYIAASALFNAGNEYFSVTQLHRVMGNTSSPTAAQVQRINDSITKLSSAKIFIDNSQEIAAKYKYPFFKYDSNLLPMERVTRVEINGQVVEAAIHLYREPPLITFARERKQVTTVPAKLLQSPISKTDANLQLEDYLLGRISREARSKTSARFLFKTIFENAGISTAKQKQRAPEKIEKYLKYYKQCDYIKDFIMGADGVTVFFKEQALTSDFLSSN